MTNLGNSTLIILILVSMLAGCINGYVSENPISVIPNELTCPQPTPKDSKRSWGLNRTRVTEVIPATRVTVAIIDTGADINHPGLKENVWTNYGEVGPDQFGHDKATNGIDDDNNGYIDDVHGWNFVGNNNDLSDNHGHGTHIAGIIGSTNDQVGVNRNVNLMIIKYYDPKAAANDNLQNTIKAVYYAVMMKAQIINYSGGGLDFSKPEYNAIRFARESGILFVAAAGNEKNDADITPYYPASYPLFNIISVSSIDPSGKILSSSNYGKLNSHIAAPGEGVYSTLPNNKYGLMTGTSQATAFVTGVASIILAENPKMTLDDLRASVLMLAKETQPLKGKTATGGELVFDQSKVDAVIKFNQLKAKAHEIKELKDDEKGGK